MLLQNLIDGYHCFHIEYRFTFLHNELPNLDSANPCWYIIFGFVVGTQINVHRIVKKNKNLYFVEIY